MMSTPKLPHTTSADRSTKDLRKKASNREARGVGLRGE